MTKTLSLAFATLALVPSFAHADEDKLDLEKLQKKKLVAKYRAQGVQHYECNGKEWVHKGPSAVLYEGNKPVATHYSCESCAPTEGGKPPAQVPAWNFFDKGQFEVERVVEKKASTYAGAIPLLALKVSSNGKGPLAKATHILRTNTFDGSAKGPCNDSNKGEWQSAKYSADYELRDSTQDAPAASGPKAGAKKDGTTSEIK